MAKRPERKGLCSSKDFNTLTVEEYALKTERNIGFDQACKLYEAYEKESELTKEELIEEMKVHENCRHSIIDKEVLADSILAAMKRKKGG